LQKLTLFLILALFVSGCSALKKETRKTLDNTDYTLAFQEDIKKNNLTNTNFDISKAEIEISGNGENQKFLGSLKYNNSGTYLFSFRSRTGIEVARIYFSKDTVLINDRMKKKLFYGSTNILNDKYGISILALPLIIGDFVDSSVNTQVRVDCKNGKTEILGVAGRNDIKYYVDCLNGKIESAIIKGEQQANDIVFLFKNFDNIENFVFPRSIELSDRTRETNINIKIIKIEFGEEVKVNFIPGINYEKILLK
jgi:hypothetical protein